MGDIQISFHAVRSAANVREIYIFTLRTKDYYTRSITLFVVGRGDLN